MRDKNIQVVLSATDKITKPLNKVGWNINKIWKSITWAFKNVWLVAWGVIWWLGWALTLEFDQAFNKLQVQTWLTWEAFKDLKSTSLDLFAKWFGQDIQTSIRAVSILNREMDLTWEELKEVSKGALLIADSFDKDVNEVIRASTALMKNYWLTGQQANDLLLKTLQETWDQYDDVLDTVNEYSLGLSQSGLAYKDFINILVSWTQLGLRNTDELWDLLRENVIRITDWSKKTRLAFKSLGLSYEKDYIEKVKKNWGNISDLIKDISRRVEGLQDPLLKTTVWVDLYWTKFEDNWVKVIGAISNMKDSLGEFNGLVNKSGKIVEDSLWSSWKQFKVTLVETLDPLKENVNAVTAWMRKNEELTKTITKIGVIVWSIAAGLAVLGWIVAWIWALLSSTLAVWVAIWAAAFSVWYAIWYVIHQAFIFVVDKAKQLWQWIKDIWSSIKEFFTFWDSDTNVNLEKNLTSTVTPWTVWSFRENTWGGNTQVTQTNDIKIEVNWNNMNSEEVASEVMRKMNDQQQLLNRWVV